MCRESHISGRLGGMKCAYRLLPGQLLLAIVNAVGGLVMMRVARFFPTVMVAALVAGCGGGQTGDLSGENDTKGGDVAAGNRCDEQLDEISLDDASALGFDARQVLALAAQGFQADLAWQ